MSEVAVKRKYAFSTRAKILNDNRLVQQALQITVSTGGGATPSLINVRCRSKMTDVSMVEGAWTINQCDLQVIVYKFVRPRVS